MGIIKTVLSTTLILSCSAISQADSIVITFENNKTQAVILEGPVKSITDVKYLSDNAQPAATPHADISPSSHTLEVEQPGKQPPQLKPPVKFKWAEPLEAQ